MKRPKPTPGDSLETLRHLQERWPLTWYEYSELDQPGEYLHWEQVRHRTPPRDLTPEEWWATIKFRRAANSRSLPLLDAAGRPFYYQCPDRVLRRLHAIDQQASGALQAADVDTLQNPQKGDRYVVSSLIEEAFRSSQLEGAATTRQKARDMIRSGRPATTISERMVLNNFRAMQRIRELRDHAMTPERVFEIHAIVTDGTLPPASMAPYLRTPGDGIAVYANDGELLHDPPPAESIRERIEALCLFANGRHSDGPTFVHPVVRAILVHFWLAHDHPFIDGNGRTARALFYWSMLAQGYWLAEFISISRSIKKAPGQYARSFLHAETDDNDATYFIDAQLGVICDAIEGLREFVGRKTAEAQRAADLLGARADWNHRQGALLGHALRTPAAEYTVSSHAMSHRVTRQTARTDLTRLAERGLLIQRQRGKGFVFHVPPDLARVLKETP